MDLSNFSTKDFLLNESFQRWVLEPDEAGKCFWESCLTTYPEKYDMITEARTQIETMHRFFTGFRSADATDVWKKISSSIEEADLETLQKR
jgi:transmembrane sensor